MFFARIIFQTWCCVIPSGQVPSFRRHVPKGDDQSGCVQTNHGGFCKVGVVS